MKRMEESDGVENRIDRGGLDVRFVHLLGVRHFFAIRSIRPDPTRRVAACLRRGSHRGRVRPSQTSGDSTGGIGEIDAKC